MSGLRFSGTVWTAAISLFLLAACSAFGQITPGMPISGAAQAYSSNWTIEDGANTTEIGQMVIPIGVFVPIRDGLEFKATTSFVNIWEGDRSSSTMTASGLSDLKLQANGTVLNRSLLLGVSVNVPTGAKGLSGEQQEVLLGFVAPDISARANQFSQGLNIGANASYAYEVNATTAVAIAGAYISRGPFDLTLPGSTVASQLNPGFELTSTLAATTFLDQMMVQAALSYTLHGKEQIDATEFQLGPRFMFSANLSRPFSDGKGIVTVAIQDMYRTENFVQSGQTLIAEALNSNGNYLVTSGSVQYFTMPWFSFTLSGAGRFISPNAKDTGSATVFEGGASLDYAVTQSLDFTVGARVIAGSGVGLSGENRSIEGFEGFFKTSYRFR